MPKPMTCSSTMKPTIPASERQSAVVSEARNSANRDSFGAGDASTLTIRP